MNLKAFLAVVAAQFVFLLAWAGWHQYLLDTSEVILLDTRPVDPRDILRGDFMILNYTINRVPPPPDGNDSMRGSPIWVVLAKRGEFYEAVSSSLAQPASIGPGQFLVLGKVGDSANTGGNPVRVAYGIEQYFVPEGKGQPRFKTLQVEATVSASHALNIKRVLVDGQPYP